MHEVHITDLPTWPFSKLANKCLQIPKINTTAGLGEDQKPHPFFIDATWQQVLGIMCPAGVGDLIVFHILSIIY